MSIQLRQYQESVINSTRSAFTSGKRAPLLVSPCGSGKTVMFSYFASRITGNGKRTLILAHRDELLDQISETLGMFNVPHSFIAANRPYRGVEPVQVGSVFSVVRRLDRIMPPDVIIVDEAHHGAKGSTWAKVLTAFPEALRIGVTATPQRLSGEPLSDMFDSLILGPSVSELIENGSLCKYRIFAPSTISVGDVHTRAGDYAKNELATAADTPTITGDAVKHYRALAHGKRAIAFCVSIEHAKHVAQEFRNAGYSSMCIDGTMERSTRRQAVQDFRDNKIQVLTSCDLISEGFDLPALEVAIMLRPTQSLALWIQQSGRALRPHPGKDYALILDHAGNTMRHGLPDEPREWTLEGRDASKKGASDGRPVKTCPKCYAVQWAGSLECKHCGYVYVVNAREVEHVDGELVEVDPAEIMRRRMEARRQQGASQSLEDLIELGKQRGYARPMLWAKHVWNARRARARHG